MVGGPELTIFAVLALLLIPLWALIDVLRTPGDAFDRAGMSQTSWVIAILLGFLVCGVGSLLVAFYWFVGGSGRERLRRSASAPVLVRVSDLRPCPYCAEQIKQNAVVCRFCGRDVEPAADNATAPLATMPPPVEVPADPEHPYGTTRDKWGRTLPKSQRRRR
jgi:hypothetical protein